jgi:hypothetical protein
MIYWSFDSGPEQYTDQSAPARLLSVITHFFTRTRWERIFRQIH